MKEQKPCEHCQNLFTPQRKTARFCCDSCRAGNHLQAKRDKDKEERIRAGLPVVTRNRAKIDKVDETEAQRIERLKVIVNSLLR